MSKITVLLVLVAMTLIGLGFFYDPIQSFANQGSQQPQYPDNSVVLYPQPVATSIQSNATKRATSTQEQWDPAVFNSTITPSPSMSLSSPTLTRPESTLLPTRTEPPTISQTETPASDVNVVTALGSNLQNRDIQMAAVEGKPDPRMDAAIPDSNSLGISIFNRLPKEFGNFVYSPAGLFSSISLLSEGSKNQSQAQLQDFLGAAGNDFWCTAFQSVISNHERGILSLWGGASIEYTNVFLERARRCYSVEPLELSADSGADVDHWFDQRGKPGSGHVVISSFGPEEGLITAHSVNFSDDDRLPQWTDHVAVVRAPFYSIGGSVRDIPYLRVEADIPCFETEDFDAVTIPYAEDTDLLIARPKLFGHLTQTLEGIEEEGVQNIIHQSEVAHLDMLVPAFSASSFEDFSDLIINNGAPAPFFPGVADLQASIQNGETFVSGVYSSVQMVFDFDARQILDENQKRSENLSWIWNKPVYVIDKAFVFFIIDRSTGLILAMGWVVTL